MDTLSRSTCIFFGHKRDMPLQPCFKRLFYSRPPRKVMVRCRCELVGWGLRFDNRYFLLCGKVEDSFCLEKGVCRQNAKWTFSVVHKLHLPVVGEYGVLFRESPLLLCGLRCFLLVSKCAHAGMWLMTVFNSKTGCVFVVSCFELVIGYSYVCVFLHCVGLCACVLAEDSFFKVHVFAFQWAQCPVSAVAQIFFCSSLIFPSLRLLFLLLTILCLILLMQL